MSESASTSNSNYVVGNYIISGPPIGQGGFGKVYKAQHMHLDKQVCIKIVQSNHLSEDLEHLLLREAQVLNKLDHKNIVHLQDLTIKDNQIYMIMDYIDGGDLATTLKNAPVPLPLDEVDHILEQIADGLHYAHQKHIIHRDLKPHNILRYKDGRVVIADFGLAKVIDATLSQSSQSHLNNAGTPAYMAPEHFAGQADYSSDLYSLGVIAYQLLTKHLPFTGTEMQIRDGQCHKAPPPLRDFNLTLPPEIEQVVLKMLAKNPQERYQSPRDFTYALHSALVKNASNVPNVNPGNIAKFLPLFPDDQIISLDPGEYQGPFTINKRLHLIGAGPLTKIFAIDKPVFYLQTSGVCLENMVIQRTPENTGEPAIQVDKDISYELRHVTILGQLTEGARWEDAEWQLPVDGINLGRVPIESKQERKMQVEVKAACTAETDMPGLAIFPTHMSPGSHTLSLEYNASGKLPGTLLDGKISLRSETEIKTIVVTGQIEQIVAAPLPEEGPSLIPMESSYVLQDKASQTLLRELGSDEDRELIKQVQMGREWRLDKEISNRAYDLLFELVGQKALIWYVKRSRVNRDNSEEEIWEFTVATDNSNALEIFTTRKKTLRLFCNVHHEGLGKPKITAIHFPKIEMGVKDLASLAVLLRLASSVPGGIPPKLIEQIQDLPIESPRELDGDQLQGWEALLQFQIDQFKKQQYWARYTRHNYRDGSPKVTFFLDKDDLKDSEREPLSYQQLQERTRKTKREMHTLFVTLPDETPAQKGSRSPKGLKIGTLEQFHVDNATMTMNLDNKIIESLNNGENLPATGYLHFDAYGDVQQIERQQRAIDDLQQGKALNPLLSDFFFDASKARPVSVTEHLQAADLLSGTCNNGQIAAIEAALTTPDLLLLQGPPGTGKTTVIAEICYQVVQKGGRVLIASQSNLAVDNALGRIIHKPSIRALRKGNADSVEDEGREFTEERVVQKWLTNTANDCQLKLEQRQKNIALFKTLLNDTAQFSYYYTREIQWEKDRFTLQHKLDMTTIEVNSIEAITKKGLEEMKTLVPIHNALSTIVVGITDWHRPGFNDVLKDVYQYIAETRGKDQLRKNINECLRLVERVGLTFPTNEHLLRGVIWLKETVHIHTRIWSESRQRISQIEVTITDLHTADDKRKSLEDSIQNTKAQLSRLASDINSYQNRLQNLTTDKNTIQKATTLYQDGTGKISLIFKEFIEAKLLHPSSVSRLVLSQFFPEKIITIAQPPSSPAILKEWDLIERAINQQIQQTTENIIAWRQASDRLSRCHQYFAQILSSHPEINQELGQMNSGFYVPIPSDIASFSQCITHIEKNLHLIHGMLTKAPSFFDHFSKERDKQQLMILCQETRDLFTIADKSNSNIPSQLRAMTAKFADMTAIRLSRACHQWIMEQQQKIETTFQAALQQKNQMESEHQQAQRFLADKEVQLPQILKMIKEHSEKLTVLFQDLSQRADLPGNLRQIAQKQGDSQTSYLAFTQNYGQLYKAWIDDTWSLESCVAELWNNITAVTEKIQTQLTKTRMTIGQQKQVLETLRAKQAAFKLTLEQNPTDILSQRSWWSRYWETIPKNLRPQVPVEGIHSLTFLETMQLQFKSWQEELEKEEAFARRFDRLITDWVTRLQNLSENDRQELKSAYLKNANVVGITCGQVYKLSYSENRDISRFNVVIIDEVSKATPPEILLPALKGKKLILIGDQRQLPPMIEDKTLDQLAEESGRDQSAFRYLNRPYFERRYEEAPDEIKRMLYIQYRMHPDIMAAINQFYDRPLECGLNQPDIQRDHQLESALIRKNKHLIWVSTPLVSSQSQSSRSQMISVRNRISGQSVFSYQSASSSFGEEKSGTSQVNHREVEIIKKVCEELQRLWAPKVVMGATPKEVGVITFYGAQTSLLQKNLGVVRDGKSMFDALNIRVGTVDRFQGIERAIVIVSMVRNNLDREIGFARKDERINVAFSRAQELLIIVGCHDLFCRTARYEQAVERYSNVAKVVTNRGDFIDISSI